jgi:tetratricopeptide (TPR) repeat protein
VNGAPLRLGLRILAAGALLFGTITARVVYSARSELTAARQAADQGDVDAAIAHYRRAARYYAPASPYHVTALEQLERLGAAAEKAGDEARALAAYRAIRGSILAARSFYVPEPERLAAADQHIARLMSEQPAPGVDAGKTRDQLYAEHLALLQASPDPSLFWSFVLLTGFAAFAGAAFAFSVRAIDERDQLIPAAAVRWGAVIVVGFGLFALGLSLA